MPLIVLIALLLSPSATLAHARLISSNPAAGSVIGAMPSQITIGFSESIDPDYSSASLLASDGASIPIGVLALAPGTNATLVVPIPHAGSAPHSVYTLVWRVLSATDGHVTSGTLAFSAGSGTAPTVGASVDASIRPPWWRVGIRWLEIVALVIASGGCFFAATRGFRLASETLRAALSTAWAVLIGALLLSLHDQAILIAGRAFFNPPPLSTYRGALFDSSGGRAWVFRFVLALVMLALSRRMFTGQQRRLIPILAAVAGAAALFSRSVSGHAAGSPHERLAVTADWVHLATVSIWFGGLVFVALALRSISGPNVAANLLAWFSKLALVAVVVLIGAGLVSAALHIAGPRSLRNSDYGLVLIAKHLAFAPALVAAGVNLLLIVPRLNREEDAPRQARLARSARRLIWAELAFGALVLIAASALTELAPADGPLAVDVASRITTIDQSAPASDLTVRLLSVLTGEPGDRYIVSVTGPDGKPPASLQRLIVVSLDAADASIGDRFDAQPLPGSPGSFFFPAVRIGLATTWNLELIVRREGVEDVNGIVQIDVRDAVVQPPRLVADAWRWPRLTAMSWLLAPLALVLLISGIIGVRRLPGLEPIAGGLALTMTGLIAAGFMVQAIRSTVPVTPGTALANPIANGPGAVVRGGATYAAYCLACHGPAGEGVNVTDSVHSHGEPAGLLNARAKRATDGDLYWTIGSGVAGTAMPAYDRALSDAERWDLVVYLRQLQASDDRPPSPGPSPASP